MNPILITGSNGLVGGSLAKALRLKGFFALTTSRTNDPEFDCDYQADLSDQRQVVGLLSGKKIDAVIHAAGRIKADDLETYRQDNVDATRNILAVAQDSGVKKFIYISTIEVYGNDGPYTEESSIQSLSSYALTKLEAESHVRAASKRNFQTVIIRLAGVHGPERKNGVIHNFIKAAKQNEPIKILDPKSTFRLSFTADIHTGIELFLRVEGFIRPVYNMAGKEALTLLDFALAIKKITNSNSELICLEGIVERNRDLRIDKICRDLGYSPLPTDHHLRSIAAVL